VEIKGQLDATDWFFIAKFMFAQHVSGTIMPIIRSSRVIPMAAACGTWLFGLRVVGLVWSCGLCVRFAGYCSSSIPQTKKNGKFILIQKRLVASISIKYRVLVSP
jgi:hypothetical protein